MSSRTFISAGIVLAFLTLTACGQPLPGTPLATAARNGDVAEIDRLVAAGADVNEPSHRKGWPPIIHAIHKRQRPALMRLLERGASLDGVVGKGALLMASGYGDAETVSVLLSHGAKPPITDGGAGGLMAAAVGGAWDIDYQWSGCERHTQVVRILLMHDPGLRRHLPNRVRGLPYSPASLAGTLERIFARWYVHSKGCDELLRMMADRA